MHSDELKMLVHPIDVVMNDILKIQLDDNQAKRVLRGSFVQMNKHLVKTKKNRMVFAKHGNKYIAFGLIKDCNFHPKKLLMT